MNEVSVGAKLSGRTEKRTVATLDKPCSKIWEAKAESIHEMRYRCGLKYKVDRNELSCVLSECRNKCE